jgi:hypothetical protein
VVITGPALIAGAAGDGWVHDRQVPGLETRHLLPNVNHFGAALMTNAKGETDDLIPDPALRVIVEIGSADARPDDPEQYVGRMLQCGVRPFQDFNFPDSCERHGLHSVSLLLFDFQSLVQFHRCARLEMPCGTLIAIAHLYSFTHSSGIDLCMVNAIPQSSLSRIAQAQFGAGIWNFIGPPGRVGLI